MNAKQRQAWIRLAANSYILSRQAGLDETAARQALRDGLVNQYEDGRRFDADLVEHIIEAAAELGADLILKGADNAGNERSPETP